jgi:hypothetical protein
MFQRSGLIIRLKTTEMRKRQKLVLTALVLASGLFVVHSAGWEIRYPLIGVLIVISWMLSAWALNEGLSGVEWLTVTLPSVLFTAGVGLFYILLPQAWWARWLIVLVFGIGQYALLLTANIFSVAAIRTIALFRAASAVGFVMTLVTGFFLFDTILSFRFSFPIVGALVFVTGFLLLLPALWSVELLPKITSRVLGFSFWLALGLGVLAVSVCFWPISISVASLFVSTMMYVFLGISQHHFSERLFTRTVGEYVTVGVVVTLTMLATAGWGV